MLLVGTATTTATTTTGGGLQRLIKQGQRVGRRNRRCRRRGLPQRRRATAAAVRGAVRRRRHEGRIVRRGNTICTVRLEHDGPGRAGTGADRHRRWWAVVQLERVLRSQLGLTVLLFLKGEEYFSKSPSSSGNQPLTTHRFLLDLLLLLLGGHHLLHPD